VLGNQDFCTWFFYPKTPIKRKLVMMTPVEKEVKVLVEAMKAIKATPEFHGSSPDQLIRLACTAATNCTLIFCMNETIQGT
jgi:hypothetical protein